MIVKSYKTHKIRVGEDLFGILDKYLPPLEEKSVIAITSKIISICQGNVVKQNGKIKKDDLVKKEADYFIKSDVELANGKIFLTRKDNHIIFSAGIDESNSDGNFILWPKKIQEKTNKIWSFLKEKNKIKNLGIIITDSRFIPGRTGALGFCIAWCGFEPFNDFRGKKDIFGKILEVTTVGVADALAASAAAAMGEADEQTPLAIVADLPFLTFQNHVPTKEEIDSMTWPIEKDLYGPLLTAVKWQKGGGK
jgi:dihydrofolate synthase / folylpolyglutamate synthase